MTLWMHAGVTLWVDAAGMTRKEHAGMTSKGYRNDKRRNLRVVTKSRPSA